jgi:hypothetical protein
VIDHQRRLVADPSLLLRERMPQMASIGGG